MIAQESAPDLQVRQHAEAHAWDAQWLVSRLPPEAAALERYQLELAQLSAGDARERECICVGLDQPRRSMQPKLQQLVRADVLRRVFRAAVASDARITVHPTLHFAHYHIVGDRAVGAAATGRRTPWDRESAEFDLEAPLILDTRPACRPRRVLGQEPGLYDAYFWGVYQGVAGVEDQQAWQYNRAAVQTWLLPIPRTDQTIVGVCAQRQPARRVANGAELWEEELVRSPELAARLMNARLSDAHAQQYCVYAASAMPPAAGIVYLDEIACPAALAFRWATLLAALHTAQSLLAAKPSATLSAGEG
jgi:hypothetical protein